MQAKITPPGCSTAQTLLLQISSWSKEVFLPASPSPDPTDPKAQAWMALVAPIPTCFIFSTTSSCSRKCLNPQGFWPAFFPPSFNGFYGKNPPRESCWMAMRGWAPVRVRALHTQGMLIFTGRRKRSLQTATGNKTFQVCERTQPRWPRAWAARREGFNCTQQSGALLVIQGLKAAAVSNLPQTLPHTLESFLPCASVSRGALWGQSHLWLFSVPVQIKILFHQTETVRFSFKKILSLWEEFFLCFLYFRVCLPSCAIKDFTCSFPCSWLCPKRSPETFPEVKRGKCSTISEEKHDIL